jgi:hypothetical protein
LVIIDCHHDAVMNFNHYFVMDGWILQCHLLFCCAGVPWLLRGINVASIIEVAVPSSEYYRRYSKSNKLSLFLIICCKSNCAPLLEMEPNNEMNDFLEREREAMREIGEDFLQNDGDAVHNALKVDTHSVTPGSASSSRASISSPKEEVSPVSLL